MTKVFEDYFSELQSDMVSLSLEYVNKQADTVYIYCAFENNMLSFDVFYELQDGVFRKHKLNDSNNGFSYNVSIDRQRALIKYGIEDLKSILELCKKHNKEIPTAMKMVYNVQTSVFGAQYYYDLQYSNKDNLTSGDIFNQWFGEVAQQ
ncbi:DUF600 domain-containing protein [Zophobihabitans entericus]|uniref:DUF600 domain-containing protein n=1 Tax=Zophobihabitans entericus TaxID=1635327 RepID=A0A6G9ID92_9GAMM|nr:DUF600 domain-containing protein [Zophobihabitans entericus]QIQ22193.1 DUF600 domain-containing protein [Zophobihabitans entericus]